ESIGYNTLIFIDDGASNAYTAVDNVVSADPAAEKLNTVESKRLTISGAIIVHVPTLFDPGEITIQQQFTQLGFSRMEGLRKNKTKKNLKVTLPDDTSTTTTISPFYVLQNKLSKVEADKITEFVSTLRVVGATSLASP